MKKEKKQTLDQRTKKKYKNKNSTTWDEDADSEENFAYIAGYTSGGVPFGITYEKWEELEESEPEIELDDKDLPF